MYHPGMVETWRTIPGYQRYYQVSDLGQVRRVRRGQGTHVGKVLRQQPRNAYLNVTLSRDGKEVTFAVHRLVCYAFHGPPPLGRTTVLHQDDDAHNNRADNLRWGTQAENNRDMWARGRRKRREAA